MAVKAVLGNIQNAPCKPFYVRFFKVPVKYLIPFLFPGKITRNVSPKALRVFYAALIFLLILFERCNSSRHTITKVVSLFKKHITFASMLKAFKKNLESLLPK